MADQPEQIVLTNSPGFIIDIIICSSIHAFDSFCHDDLHYTASQNPNSQVGTSTISRHPASLLGVPSLPQCPQLSTYH